MKRAFAWAAVTFFAVACGGDAAPAPQDAGRRRGAGGRRARRRRRPATPPTNRPLKSPRMTAAAGPARPKPKAPKLPTATAKAETRTMEVVAAGREREPKTRARVLRQGQERPARLEGRHGHQLHRRPRRQGEESRAQSRALRPQVAGRGRLCDQSHPRHQVSAVVARHGHDRQLSLQVQRQRELDRAAPKLVSDRGG